MLISEKHISFLFTRMMTMSETVLITLVVGIVTVVVLLWQYCLNSSSSLSSSSSSTTSTSNKIAAKTRPDPFVAFKNKQQLAGAPSALAQSLCANLKFPRDQAQVTVTVDVVKLLSN